MQWRWAKLVMFSIKLMHACSVIDRRDKLHDNSGWIQLWSSSCLVDQSVWLPGSLFLICGIQGKPVFYCTTMNWNDQGFNCDFNWISVKVSQMTQLYAEMWTLLQERKIEHNIIQRTRREVSYANTKGMSWVLVIRASSSRPKHLANGGQNTSPAYHRILPVAVFG